jgi:hypothetical protein
LRCFDVCSFSLRCFALLCFHGGSGNMLACALCWFASFCFSLLCSVFFVLRCGLAQTFTGFFFVVRTGW